MPAKVTEADVIKALRKNPEFTKAPDDLNLNVLRPFIPKLIKCVNAVGANTQVSWGAIANVIASFIQELLCGRYLQDVEEEHRQRHGLTSEFLQQHGIGRVAPITRQLERELQAYKRSLATHDRWLEQEGLTEAQFMTDHTELNDEAKRLYRSGQLTLGKLLVVQPDRLLPEPHCLFIWNDGLPA